MRIRHLQGAEDGVRVQFERERGHDQRGGVAGLRARWGAYQEERSDVYDGAGEANVVISDSHCCGKRMFKIAYLSGCFVTKVKEKLQEITSIPTYMRSNYCLVSEKSGRNSDRKIQAFGSVMWDGICIAW